MVEPGDVRPRKRPSKWMRDGIRPGHPGAIGSGRPLPPGQNDPTLEIHDCVPSECPVSGEATWFIDPPYQVAGRHYRFGSEQLDYARLAKWCRSRPGQVIVCENEGADWLPFRPLAAVKTTRAKRRSKEVIWARPHMNGRSAQVDAEK